MFKLSKTDVHPQQTQVDLNVPSLFRGYASKPLPSLALPTYTNADIKEVAPSTEGISSRVYIPSLASVFKNVGMTKPEDLIDGDWDNLDSAQIWADDNGRYVSNHPFLNTLIQKESEGNPNRVSPTGASGLYQITGDTWNEFSGGLDKKLRFNPQEAHKVALKVLKNRINYLKSHGFDLTTDNVYLAYMMGPGGARRILSNLDAPLSSVYTPKEYEETVLVNLDDKSRAYYLQHPEELTGRVFRDYHGKKFRRK